MTTHKMEFKTPAVQPGLNQTIRSGDKWLKARPGDVLDIHRSGDPEPEFPATVIGAVQVTAKELMEGDLLRFSHVPGARTFSGLHAAMSAAYGEDWMVHPIVIVWFWVG